MRFPTGSIVLIGCLASTATTLSLTPYAEAVEPEDKFDLSKWHRIDVPDYPRKVLHKPKIVARSPKPFNPYRAEDSVKASDEWESASNYYDKLKAQKEAMAIKEKHSSDKRGKVMSLPLIRREKKSEMWHKDPAAWLALESERVTAKYYRPPPEGPHNQKRETSDDLTDSADADSLKRAPVAKNSAHLHNDGNDLSYLVEVEFGTHRQKHMLVVDTGSSDTWIYNKDCTDKACLTHEQYDHVKSHDFKYEEHPFMVVYGTGNSSGTFVQDRMKVGPFDFITRFGLVNKVSDLFVNFPLDGILAMGFNNVSMSGMPGFLQELKDNKLIERKTFGMALSQTDEGTHDGVINFGGYDPSYFDGNLSFANVSGNEHGSAYWQVPLQEISVWPNTTVDLEGEYAILDSGTSLLLLPPVDAAWLHREIPGALTNGHSFSIPCNTSLSITIKINGIEISLPPDAWIAEPMLEGKLGDMWCASLITGQKGKHSDHFGKGTWILGDTFMKYIYTYFDADLYRIGIAKKRSKAKLFEAWNETQYKDGADLAWTDIRPSFGSPRPIASIGIMALVAITSIAFLL